eukprot:7257063-Pyramimonas_sp.AAC.1
MSHAMACDTAAAAQAIPTRCTASVSRARLVSRISSVSRTVRPMSLSLHGMYGSQFVGKVLSMRKHRSCADARNMKPVTTQATVADVATTESPRVRHTKGKRVVISGMGVVSPLGNDTDEFYNNLLE